MDKKISGNKTTSEFSLPAGESAVLNGPLTVEGSGDIEILGDLVRDPDTPFGSGITLHTTDGSIVVAGQLQSAPGDVGNTPKSSEIVIAGSGTDGGAITLISDKGSVTIRKGASIETGRGGWGGNASAAGSGLAPLVKAVSGKGGTGGAIVLSAKALMVIDGELRTGEGGRGGKATAVDKFAAVTPPAGTTETPQPSDGPPPAATTSSTTPSTSGVTEATALKGGNGGDIAVTTTASEDGRFELRGKVLAGSGGMSAAAEASGGKSADARLEAGGRGGNVRISMFATTKITIGENGAEVAGGNGGNCGDTTLPAPDPNQPPAMETNDVERATAAASDGAVAWVGYPAELEQAAGGAAGTATLTIAVTGEPSQDSPISWAKQANGGDSTNAKATALGTEKSQSGSRHKETVPGKVAKVAAP